MELSANAAMLTQYILFLLYYQLHMHGIIQGRSGDGVSAIHKS